MYLPVTKFYAGKSIFLTGGTGFLGKVILEKLLYSCLVENIYVLVRVKKGVDAEQRIKNLVESPLFTRLKREKFHDLGRIVPIVGDLGLHNLGLSKTDEQILLNKVSVTFHAAASVKFEEPLKAALNQNVDGTRNVVDLCRRMKHIQALVHISTAFCQSDKEVVEEIVYSPPAALEEVYSHQEKSGEDKNKLKELLRDDQTVKLNNFLYGTNVEIEKKNNRVLQKNCKLTRAKCPIHLARALVHISTAFCQSDKEVVEEIVYSPPAALEEVYSHQEKSGEDKNKLKELLNGRPNTYTFSKALAETLVTERRGHVPTVIIRPSIVLATYREPFPSWVDGWSAASLMLTFVAKGLIRTQMGHKNFVTDIIPVDYVSNLSIVAASRCSSSNEVTVYNSCTSDVNPLSCQDSFNLFTKECLNHNFNDLPMPGFVFVTSKWMKTLLIFVLETVPAYIMDFFSLIQGKNQRYVKLHKKISVIRDTCEPFIARSWLLTSQNTRDLATSLSSYDREMFPFNPANIVWKDYIPIHYEGVKKYLIKRKKKNDN